MLKIKNLLHATDFSPCANQALQEAIFLAKKYEARLHVFHAIVLHGEYDPINPAYNFQDSKKYLASLEQSVQQKTDDLLQSFDTGTLEIVRAQERGVSPAPVILDYASEIDADLIVTGAHGRRGLGHLVMGSVAEEVVRAADCPVLTIHEKEQPVGATDKKRILVPIDFSDNSLTAIAHAKHIASTYNATIQLLHVFEQPTPPAFYWSDKEAVLEFMPHIVTASEHQLEQTFGDAGGPETPFEIFVEEGRAANEILKFAEKHDSDMIVMNTHGLTGIMRLVLGSVAEKVSRLARCPVFTIRAFGKSLLES